MVSKWSIGRRDWINLLKQMQEEGYQKEIPRSVLIREISKFFDIAKVSQILRMMKDADELGILKMLSPTTFEITAEELMKEKQEMEE